MPPWWCLWDLISRNCFCKNSSINLRMNLSCIGKTRSFEIVIEMRIIMVEAYAEPCQISNMELFAKRTAFNRQLFRKKLHLSCLTGFRILLRKYFTKLLGARKGQIHWTAEGGSRWRKLFVYYFASKWEMFSYIRICLPGYLICSLSKLFHWKNTPPLIQDFVQAFDNFF